MQNGIKVEMLDQNPQFEEGVSVREAIENELTELKAARQRYDALSMQLGESFDDRAVVEEHARLGAFLDTHNAWSLDDKVERILQEFELKIYESKPVALLSGGEQRRVALAGLLLKKTGYSAAGRADEPSGCLHGGVSGAVSAAGEVHAALHLA